MKFDYFPQRSPDSRNQISLMYEAGISANLELLSVDPNNVPFDFSCGVPGLDDKHIMIDKLGIVEGGDGNKQATLCSYRHILKSELKKSTMPYNGFAIITRITKMLQSDLVSLSKNRMFKLLKGTFLLLQLRYCVYCNISKDSNS